MTDAKPNPTNDTPAQTSPDPAAELREAAGHFIRAAELFLDRASKDPAVRIARDGAVEALRRFGETAEPLAGAAVRTAVEAASVAQERVRRAGDSAPPTAKRVIETTEAAASEAGRVLVGVAGRVAELLAARRTGGPAAAAVNPPAPPGEPAGAGDPEPRS